VALIVVAVVASVEAAVGSVEDAEEEGTVTEGDLETGAAVDSEAAEVAAALEEVGMTLDHREVVAIGAGVVVWVTKEVDSTMVRLPAGTEDLLGLVDLVGFLPAGVRALVPPAAVALAVMAVTEDISSERAQEVSTTETQSGHGSRFVASCTPRGAV